MDSFDSVARRVFSISFPTFSTEANNRASLFLIELTISEGNQLEKGKMNNNCAADHANIPLTTW